MDVLIQLTLTGVFTGALYAILGLSFGLIYSVTRVFHFADAATYAVSAYVAWLFVRHLGWSLIAAAVPAVVAAVGLGVAAEVGVYRPMRRRMGLRDPILIASLGIYVIVQNALQMMFGRTVVTYDPSSVVSPIFFGNLVFNARDILTVGLALAVLTVVHLMLKVKAGRALRAVVDSRRMAEVVGIDVDKASLLAYVVGSALVVPAAMLMVSMQGATPSMGLQVLFPMAAATIVGGIGSLRGAALAGFLIGVAQNLLVFKIGGQWQIAMIFFVMILFILYRPQGLFGQPVARMRL